MRIVFMGTPDIAATCLSAILAEGKHTVAGVVCQPDKPQGRGMVLTPPPVKRLALEKGIPVSQPATLKGGVLLPLLSVWRPGIIVVVAYGKILPTYVLSFAPYGCINLHVSLLPKYRGAAPMQRAIMAGETETGVCVMQMDAGLDTGDVLAKCVFPITDEDDFGTVHDTSAELGGALLCQTLAALKNGTVIPEKQVGEPTYAEKITKADTALDFSLPADVLFAKIRGLSPIPLAYTKTPDGKLLKVVKAARACGEGRPGEVIALSTEGEGRITVACGEGAIALISVLPEGKGRMKAADMIRGRKIKEGDILSL